MRHTMNWQVGPSESYSMPPNEMVTAQVPGNANLDWINQKGLPDWKRGINYKQLKWQENCWWLYETRLPKLTLKAGEQLFFVTEGIDYQYRILLDGEMLCEHEGMFSRVEIPIVYKEDAVLQVWIAPVPKDPQGVKDTREEAAQNCKPAAAYGWDWHPRLIPSGIWEDTYLEVRQKAYISEVEVEYTLNDDYTSAEVHFCSEIIGTGVMKYMIYDPDGARVGECMKDGSSSLTITTPALWWCNGYGIPNLYRYEAQLLVDGEVIDLRSGTIGFRTLKLTMNEGTWDEPKEFPMGRSPVPITITLNGVTIFAKGSNWVNPEVFTGSITYNTYLPLIKLAKEANFNILRCWGGAIINKKAFFDLCDEHGILVWQEFMLACNNYRGTNDYLKILEQEATAIIKRLKKHPSLAIWCGGNELFNSWSRMTDQSKALRLLNKLCYEFDPGRPFLMTSPLHGMAHGGYAFRYPDGKEVYEVIPKAYNTAYTEFGIPSISNLSCCDMIAKREQLFPLVENEITKAHHAFGAWVGESWSDISILQSYFGEAKSLEQLIEWSQWLQGEGYKCIFEEARRQKPHCSMAINWCFNEPWPTLANNSIINYPATPKTSFKEVTAACRNALISARLPQFSWRGGEIFAADLWLLNDGQTAIAAGKAKVYLELCGKSYFLQEWQYDGVPANKNLEGPTVRLKLPEFITENDTVVTTLNQSPKKRDRGLIHEMKLVIEAGEMSSTYRLVFYE